MKTKVLIAGAGVAALIAGIALAQAGGHGERMFKRADIDGDGRVTEAESATLRKTRFRMLDANADGAVDIADAIAALAYLFTSGPASCLSALDANDDGAADIADPISVLGYLFSGGTAPSAPFPGCGSDPTPDALDCATPQPSC